MERVANRSPVQARLSLAVASSAVALCLAVFGCAPSPESDSAETRTAQVDEAVARARAAADQLGLRLMTELGAQLESGTPAVAIDVCSNVAPAAAAELSGEGLRIRRTSLRYRNPANAPGDWERAKLRELEEIGEPGGWPAEIHEVDEVAGELRYLRPIGVGAACLQCHGTAVELDPEVLQRVAERYPEDRATGFSTGDLRGAFSVRVRLEAAGTS